MDRAVSPLEALMAEVFGFSDFRPGQREIVEAVVAGRDVLAIMPTGGGKSLCYQLPALVLGGLTIVVSPLVALMRDQVRALQLNGIPAATINSDISRADNVETWHAVRRASTCPKSRCGSRRATRYGSRGRGGPARTWSGEIPWRG